MGRGIRELVGQPPIPDSPARFPVFMSNTREELFRLTQFARCAG
jgi:hypothetical protein